MISKKLSKYLIVVNNAGQSTLESVAYLRRQKQWSMLEIVVVSQKGTNPGKYIGEIEGTGRVKVINVNYADYSDIQSKLSPILSQVVGIVCRGDKNIQYLRELIPILPPWVRCASVASLQNATNKQLMRKAFDRISPDISPRNLSVNNYSTSAINRIEKTIGYPVIVKPTDLASSLLVQSCYSRVQLDATVKEFFEIAPKVYKREGRLDRPHMIAEEYLEGDFYSIDAYVLDNDKMFFCPPVAYTPAKKLGVDDFFIYKRSIEPGLSHAEITRANIAAKEALLAIGLQNSSAHIELVRTTRGWKIIELGPRLGRFRHHMYSISYGINHALNDIKVHLGIIPSVPKRLLNYSAGYCIYPLKEGKLKRIAGLDWVLSSPNIVDIKVFTKPGMYVKFAKHGGHGLAEFLMYSPNKQEYQRLTKKIEETVRADID